VPVDAPTTERGHAGVRKDGFGLTFSLRSVEEVVDLTWPTAVRVYDRMRRTDSKVSMSIRSMFLPIMAADWRIDPRGARDEVVQRLADDLGLPIVDGDDPAPVRTRDRFDWGFHLRHALLSRLFGFMPFEQVYRPHADGYHRLRKLAPRMPHTLTSRGIRIAQDGGLEGIEQQPPDRGGKPVFIEIERLVMYVHEREGANWQGTSILRSVYRDWLLKDHFHRIAAIAIDRNGAGIPIYTDQEGASPTDAAAGQALAEGYRVGENAGGRIPFGAAFRLVGVEGELPDILAHIRYHDEQIAQNVLDMFSSLPSAKNGSRALGESMIDFFTLALNAHSGDLATVTTNHVVEDWVDVNYGPGEPAPSVVCGEIGADQEPTAVAISQLVKVGALTKDPALERYLRRVFGMPELEAPSLVPEEDVEEEEPERESVSPAPVSAAAGQRPGVAKRDLHAHELAAQVDFEVLDEQWTDQTEALVAVFVALREQWTDELVAQIEQASSLDDLEALGVSTGAGADALSDAMLAAAALAAVGAITEASRQGVDITVPDFPDETFRPRASTVERLLADSLRSSAVSRAVIVSQARFDPATVAASVRSHLAGLSDRLLRDHIGGAVTAAQNAGRIAVIEQADATVYASEILDGSTCVNCAVIDGHVFADMAEARDAYPAGGYRDCLGGPRCRGTLVAVFVESLPSRE
jgi:hypothetical protein